MYFIWDLSRYKLYLDGWNSLYEDICMYFIFCQLVQFKMHFHLSL